MTNNHVTVGVFYELPNGQIAYTYGFDDQKKVVSYRLDGDTTGRTITYEEIIKSWKPRFDLYDFPDSSDPKLPYLFDLNWDIRYMSELRRVLAAGHPQLDEIKQAMRKWLEDMRGDSECRAGEGEQR